MTMWHAVIAIAIVTGIHIVGIVAIVTNVAVAIVAGCRFIVN